MHKSSKTYNLPRFKLRPTAPKNPVPLKENIFDLISWPSSPSLVMYIIPALKMTSVAIEVKPWIVNFHNKILHKKHRILLQKLFYQMYSDRTYHHNFYQLISSFRRTRCRPLPQVTSLSRIGVVRPQLEHQNTKTQTEGGMKDVSNLVRLRIEFLTNVGREKKKKP